MRLKELQGYLQDVRVFEHPKMNLEQYPTSSQLASHMLYTIDQSFGEVEGATVADLGTGCGILSIAASLLGADIVYSFDIDGDALAIAQANITEFELTNVELLQVNIAAHDAAPQASKKTAPRQQGRGKKTSSRETVKHADLKPFCLTEKVDIVVMNPPFGTKDTPGIDILFLKRGLEISKRAVYSLHKTSTRSFLAKKAAEWGVKFEVLAELRYDIPKMYKFHKKNSVDIEVDFIRLSHPE